MAYIFISYALDDGQEIVDELQQMLEENQHRVLSVSDDRAQESGLEREIKASNLFVTLVTAAASESQGIYRALKLAQDQKKPILAITVDSGLPPFLIDVKAIDLKGSDVTPIVREIELAAITSDRQRERNLARNVIVSMALIAILIISYLLMRPQIDMWIYDTFVPTPTPTMTFTPRPTRTPQPSATPTQRITSLASGGQIVFSRTTYEEIDRHTEDIFVLDLATGEETQLTDDPSDDDAPVWSPDGAQIAFHSNREGNFDIYIMNADGSNLLRLTEDSANEFSPEWSPDGKSIVYVRDGVRAQIYTVDVKDGEIDRLTDNFVENKVPVWVRGSNQIAFISSGNEGTSFLENLYLMDDDGDDRTRLTDLNWFLSGHAWSPDGSQFVANAFLDEHFDIFLFNLDGTFIANVTDDIWDEESLAWTPDGEHILFTIDRDNTDIYMIDPDGTNQTRLTNTPENEFHPDWRP